ncbi:hypothetical protein SUGI_0581780 [Cryptomeria japonica]|uniref:cytochrome P450 CYP82D47 n=1 Tax=Cryptomeria japonica TaxID=3369 RepID=UPI0024147AF8|nr:cytochrome P450 CYP82D47 [Cryptomeria japonica]GLJ29512.1 hypothetical protein SUGI_0581780 [Cryptomeria japonica]
MEFEELTVLALALTILFLIANQLRNRNNKQFKPPQPPSWPIIGHLHLFNKNRQLHRVLCSLSHHHGPIMLLQLGCRPVLVISSSQLAKECLSVNDRVFASRPSLLAAKHMGYDSKILAWLPYCNYWRDLRKICTLQLFTGHRIESLRHVRVDEVSNFIRSLFESSGQQVNMKSRLGELAFNIILFMVASKKITRFVKSEEFRKFRKIIDEAFLLAGTFNVGDYLPFLQWVDVHGLKAAMKELQKKRDDFMQKLVKAHRQRQQDHGVQQPQDLIDVLISATDNHEILSDSSDTVVKATATAMLSAGTDTTAVTIEWAMAALLKHPHILKKAQQELDTHIGRDRVVEESDLHKLKYLEAIVKETLRLYPAAPVLIPHESTESCSVGGYEIPAGARLIVNVWAIHRDPAVWERPTEFDPERFLQKGREIDVKGHNFELIPFGSGRRMCPGISLALCLVSYTLARLLQSFEWSVPEGMTIDMSEGLGLTMPKAVPLQAIIKPRLPPHFY